MVSIQSFCIFLLFALLAFVQADVHHHVVQETGGKGHDGNLFDDAASVLDNFFG